MNPRAIFFAVSMGLGLAIKAYQLYSIHQKAKYYRSLAQRDEQFNKLRNRIDN